MQEYGISQEWRSFVEWIDCTAVCHAYRADGSEVRRVEYEKVRFETEGPVNVCTASRRPCGILAIAGLFTANR